MELKVRFLLIALIAFAIYGTLDTPSVSAQKLSFDNIPEFKFADDSFFATIAPDTDFNWKLDSFREDVQEVFTFDSEEKEKLILTHAKNQQDRIDDLDMRGLPIPLELEERRIQKINEAVDLANNRVEKGGGIGETFDEEIELLKTMGELNDIRVLYSQLPEVVNADEATKISYNEKINSLDTWQKECTGDFNVEEMKPLREAVGKIQDQCPKLKEYEERFGLDRIRMIVSGSI